MMLRARHILSTTGATLASGGFALGLTILVARLLTPEQNGHYAQFVLVFNLVYIGLNFGLGPASTFFVASNRASVRAVSRLNLGVLVGLTCLLVAAAWLIHGSGLARSVEGLLKMPPTVLYVGLIAGILLLSINQVMAILMGGHRYDLVNALNVSRAALPLVLVGVLSLACVPSVSLVAIAQSVAMGLALLLAVWTARRSLLSADTGAINGSTRYLWAMLGYGGLVYLSNLLHYLAMRGLLLLLSYFSAPESVGFLSLALLFLEVTLLLPSAIGQLVFPQSSIAGFNHAALDLVLRVNMYIGLALVSLILLFAQPIVALLLGEAYAPVAQTLIHLGPSVVLLAVPRILSQLLSGQGHPQYPLMAAVLSLLLGTFVAIWAIPRWGYLGAAWVTNLVSAITATVTLIGYCRVHRIRLAQILVPQHQDWQSIRRLATRTARG